jgi:inhibitor of cysteine peptidase
VKTKIGWAAGILLSALCAWMGSGAHAGAHSPHDPAPSHMLTEKDDGRVVIVRVGDEVRVALPENASTGFRWAVDHVDGDVIEVLGEDAVYSSGATSGAVGSGGTAVFRFRARKRGSGELGLKHWRHWEGDASIIRRFSIQLKVQP